MQTLKQKWTEMNVDERETVLIAYWTVKGKKEFVTPGELTNMFLNTLFTKKEIVERVFTNCNATRINPTLNNPVKAVWDNEDSFSILGFDPYQLTMLRLVSENTVIFKQAVEVFRKV